MTYSVGREIVPLVSACGSMWEVLRPSGGRLCVVTGPRTNAQAVCDELNALRATVPATIAYGARDGQAISTLRALKNARDVIENLAVPEQESDDDRMAAALDDLGIMIGAVR